MTVKNTLTSHTEFHWQVFFTGSFAKPWFFCFLTKGVKYSQKGKHRCKYRQHDILMLLFNYHTDYQDDFVGRIEHPGNLQECPDSGIRTSFLLLFHISYYIC